MSYPQIEQNTLILFTVVLSMISLLEGNLISLAFGSVTNQGTRVISSMRCLPPTTDSTGTLPGQQSTTCLPPVYHLSEFALVASQVSDSGGHSLLGLCLLEWMGVSGRGVWLITVVYVWGWTYSRYFFNLSLVWLLAASEPVMSLQVTVRI